FACMWILKKKVNALWLILGLFVVGILGYWSGILVLPPAGYSPLG
ncbi:PTS system mannose/fructose/sorbose family transporter subunit IID, partial [Klebsiella pneumoniae]|nr:PTS system mannose/fructose/sorbose family transporter subunit IID [Klebsiella pneumoniae]